MNNFNNIPLVVLRNRKMTLPIFSLPTVLGRNDQAVDVYLFHESISREHCVFDCIDGIPTIQDLGSTVGTFLNGGRLQPGIPYQLEHGSKLKIGKVKFSVEVNPDAIFQREQPSFASQPEPQEEAPTPEDGVITIEARMLGESEYDESEVVYIDCGIGSDIEEEAIEEELLSEEHESDVKETQSMDMEEAEEAFAAAEEEVVSNLLETDDEATVILSCAQARQPEDSQSEEVTKKTTLSWIDDESGEIMRLVIDKYPFSIGRKTEENDYVIRRKGISRKHMTFDVVEGEVCICDENSTNGVRIGGSKIEPGEYTKIESGSGIRAGGITFAVKIEE